MPQRHHLLHVGAPEPIDGLLGIAHHEKLAPLRQDFRPMGSARSDGVVIRNRLSKEHGNFGLYRVGVLGLVDEQVRILASEMVPDFQVVSEQIPRPYQQVVELGATFGAALVGIVDGEPAEAPDNRYQAGVSHLLDLGIGVLVQVRKQRFEARARIFARFRIGLPISLPSSALPDGQDVQQQPVRSRRSYRHFRKAAQPAELALHVIVQRISSSILRVFAQPLHLCDGIRKLRRRGWGRVWRRIEGRTAEVAVVGVETLRDLFQVGGRQAECQHQRQVRSQVGLAVQVEIQPCVPSLVEPDARHDLVAGVESRRESGLQRTFAENPAGK